MKRAAMLIALALAACTPGAVISTGGGSGPSGPTTTIDVNLTQHGVTQTPEGVSQGYAPPVTMVAVGSTIRFVNSDGFAHTATLIAEPSFPAGSPFTASAQTRSGTALSQTWSTGTLTSGSASQTLLVDKPGTYLYGCFFHYGSPMRGVIVAQ